MQLWPVLQVAERLRTDPRVVVIDRTNLRYLQLQDLPGDGVPVDLISLDLSFISVLKVMPAVCELLRPGGVLIVLVKPQFEASREQVNHISLLPMLLESSRSSGTRLCLYHMQRGRESEAVLWETVLSASSVHTHDIYAAYLQCVQHSGYID